MGTDGHQGRLGPPVRRELPLQFPEGLLQGPAILPVEGDADFAEALLTGPEGGTAVPRQRHGRHPFDGAGQQVKTPIGKRLPRCPFAHRRSATQTVGRPHDLALLQQEPDRGAQRRCLRHAIALRQAVPQHLFGHRLVEYAECLQHAAGERETLVRARGDRGRRRPAPAGLGIFVRHYDKLWPDPAPCGGKPLNLVPQGSRFNAATNAPRQGLAGDADGRYSSAGSAGISAVARDRRDP